MELSVKESTAQIKKLQIKKGRVNIQPKLTKWTDKLDHELLIYVQSFPILMQGIRSFSHAQKISIDSVRNHWYSHKLKLMRGEIVEEACNSDLQSKTEENKTNQEDKTAHDSIDTTSKNKKAGNFTGRKIGSKNKAKTIRRVKEDIVNSINNTDSINIGITETIEETVEEITQESNPTSKIINMPVNNINPPFVPFKFDDEITTEAKQAIDDVNISLLFFNEGINKLLYTNSLLLKDNESMRLEFNRLLKSHKELEESYTYMLRLLNKAREQALQEEDKDNRINSVSNRSSSISIG